MVVFIVMFKLIDSCCVIVRILLLLLVLLSVRLVSVMVFIVVNCVDIVIFNINNGKISIYIVIVGDCKENWAIISLIIIVIFINVWW